MKKRVKKYIKLRPQIHAALVYCLINDELQKYSSIKICPDVGKNAIHNNLLHLFKDNEHYAKLRNDKKIRIEPVGHSKSPVNDYVKDLKKKKLEPTIKITLPELQSILLKFKHRKPIELNE